MLIRCSKQKGDIKTSMKMLNSSADGDLPVEKKKKSIEISVKLSYVR